MKPTSYVRTLVLVLLALVGVGLLTGAYIVTTGVSARQQPSRLEAITARTVRSIAIRTRVRGITNPVPVGDAVIKEGMEHFADHCASCHGNNGRGDTAMGRNLFPKAPDMTLAATQNKTDGELYWIIENGIRLTGMPAWGKGGPDDADSWKLVHFIRHLQHLTAEDLKAMAAANPKSPSELEEEKEDERFLAGEDVPSPVAPHHH